MTDVLTGMPLPLAEEAAAPAAGQAVPWALIGLVAGIVLLVVLVMLYLAKYLRLAVNLFLETPLPLTADPHDYAPPDGEVVTFPSLEGRRLRGMFIEPPPVPPN